MIPPTAHVGDINAHYSNGDGLATLQSRISSHIVAQFLPAPPQDRVPASSTGLLLSEPRRSPHSDYGVYVPPMPAPSGGFAGGLPSSGMRDPLFMGGVGGGGLFVGPSNALFQGDDEMGGFGMPGGLPYGVPPGARYDPFGPPDPGNLKLPPGGRGRGRGSTSMPPFGM